MKCKLILLLLLLGVSPLSFSQKKVREQIRAGNKEYKLEKYTESEISYRKALESNARSTDAAYNLGNSLYKQSKFPEAAEQYQATISQEKDKSKLASAWHNTGNIFMNSKEYAKSIDAYKQALRNNPSDDETRYNLALAQKLLDDQQKQDQDKDKDKDKDKEKEDKKEDQKQDQQKQEDQKKQQQQQQQQQMSKENADQILDAMMQNEKNTQDKVKEQQMKQQQRKRTDKEW